jgi:transposase InsO family protein
VLVTFLLVRSVRFESPSWALKKSLSSGTFSASSLPVAVMCPQMWPSAGRRGRSRRPCEPSARGGRSRKRVAASMVLQGLVARSPRRWRRTTDSNHAEPIAPDGLERDFSAPEPDRVWVADTTYLPVLGGFLFLVVILDLFSRKVVGWSLGDRLDAELSGEALKRALARRAPRSGSSSIRTGAQNSRRPAFDESC